MKNERVIRTCWHKSQGTPLRTVFLVVFLGLLVSCGGDSVKRVIPDEGNVVTPVPSIAISPANPSVKYSFSDAPSTLQFSATVQNAADKKVVWQVNGIGGGDSSVGTISGNGLYTAPLTATVSYVVVSAVLSSDSRYSASTGVRLDCGQRLALQTPEGTSVGLNGRLPLIVAIESPCQVSYPRVDWTVDGVYGGTPGSGVVTPSSQPNQVWYYPPATIPNAPVTVTAEIRDDSGSSFSVLLNVTAAEGAVLTISPYEVTLGLGVRQQLRAVREGVDVEVTWLVNAHEDIDASSGWIIDGVYRSPYTEPDPNPVILTAVDRSSVPNRFASALVTVKAPGTNDNARLHGKYAAWLGGTLGTLTFDGGGNMTGSLDWGGTKYSASGTYELGFDSRLSLHVQLNASDYTPSQQDWNVILTSDNYGIVIGNQGFLERQNLEGFTPVNFVGTYVTALTQISYCWYGWCGTQEQVLGALRPDGAGQITGQSEANGAPESLTGSYAISDDGTGTVTLVSNSSAINCNGSILFVSKDKFVISAGNFFSTVFATAERQSPTVTIATLNGPYVFRENSLLGRFEADGAGTLAGTYDYGSVEMFQGYSYFQDFPMFATYTVDDWGRVASHWQNPDVTEVFYLVSPGKFVSAHGVGYAQSQAVDPESIFGRYTWNEGWTLLDETQHAVGVMNTEASFAFEYSGPVTGGKGKGTIVAPLGTPPFMYPPFYVVSENRLLFMNFEANRIEK